MLGFISERAPVAARDVIEHFGAEQELARTTILTVIERLRKKGYVSRERRANEEGVWVYSPRVAHTEVMAGIVRQFVEKTLQGSVSPVVAYLSRGRRVSDEELSELQQLVDDLKAERDNKP